MHQRSLGPGAVPVSAVGYGGMHLSLEGRPPEAEALRVLHAALDAGVTLVDTADVYCRDEQDLGHNERLIARALGSWSGPRESIVVATKGGLVRRGTTWQNDARPDQLRAACERSLRALGVEQIALYQLHAPDPAVPFEESVGALAALREEGKVRWLGLSNVSVEQIEQARRIAPIESVQNRLNPYFREALTGGVVAHCAAQGLGFLAYSPTGGGRLTLKLPSHPVLQRIAERRGVTPHAVVIAWVLSKSPTVIPIPSARRVEHALDSIAAAALGLSEEELREVDGAVFDKS